MVIFFGFYLPQYLFIIKYQNIHRFYHFKDQLSYIFRICTLLYDIVVITERSIGFYLKFIFIF